MDARKAPITDIARLIGKLAIPRFCLSGYPDNIVRGIYFWRERYREVALPEGFR